MVACGTTYQLNEFMEESHLEVFRSFKSSVKRTARISIFNKEMEL